MPQFLSTASALNLLLSAVAPALGTLSDEAELVHFFEAQWDSVTALLQKLLELEEGYALFSKEVLQKETLSLCLRLMISDVVFLGAPSRQDEVGLSTFFERLQ